MVTINRLSLGLGAGIVLVGCASPTDETFEDELGFDEASAALMEDEVAPDDVLTGDAEAALSADEIAAMQTPDLAEQDPVDEPLAEQEDGPTGSKSDAIILGGRWGGFGPWGGGIYGARFYGGGLYGGGLYGVPFYGRGFYGGVPYGGFYGAPFVRGVGWGGWGGCGLYGCGRMWW